MRRFIDAPLFQQLKFLFLVRARHTIKLAQKLFKYRLNEVDWHNR